MKFEELKKKSSDIKAWHRSYFFVKAACVKCKQTQN